MSSPLDCQFLGGGNEVGNVAMLLDYNRHRFLFDYGMAPGKPPSFPLPPPPVDLTLLSHGHLDHSGMIPWLCAQSDQTINATEVTGALSNLLQKDSIKIAQMDGYSIPYGSNDVREAEHSLMPVEPGTRRSIGEDTEIRFHTSGHIPGSLMFELRGAKTVLFTGDFNVTDTHLVKGTSPVKCDVLFMEGTYAGRDHVNRIQMEKAFVEKINEVVNRGGVAIVPAFALARAQEILIALKDQGLDIWFDGMGKKISKIFMKYPQYLRSPKDLKKAMKEVNLVHSDHGRKLALKADVIVTSSGMMDGGPIVSYMMKFKNDKKSAVLLTGYQVEGTNSRLLFEKGKMSFYGVVEAVDCEVEYFDFSAHAGHTELVNFAKACKPEKIVLFHSDNRTPLVESLRDSAEVLTPMNGEAFQL